MGEIVIISGSPSHPSRSSAISEYLEKRIVKEGLQANSITVRDLPAEDLVYANYSSKEIQQALEEVKQAQGVIVVSPVYKASFPGLLKTFLDLIPEKGLENKVILPIVTGGTIAHLLSVEYAFKPVFSVLGANEIYNEVYLIDSQVGYKEKGLTFAENELEQRLNHSLDELLYRVKKEVILTETAK